MKTDNGNGRQRGVDDVTDGVNDVTEDVTDGVDDLKGDDMTVNNAGRWNDQKIITDRTGRSTCSF